MATGIELVLGFQYPKWQIAEAGLGLKLRRPVTDDPEFANFEPGFFDGMSDSEALAEFWETADITEYLVGDVDKINAQLCVAHQRACDDMGFTLVEANARHHYRTPLGDRELTPFTLEFIYDPYEMGDEPEDAVIGVPISSRYFPCFLDWRDRHGTIYNQVIGPIPPKEMTIARTRIIEALPVFEQADWIVVLKHY